MLHRFTKDVCVEHAFEKAWWMRELMVCQILTVSLLVKSLLDIKTICEHLWTVSCSFHMEGSWKYDWRPPGNCQMLWSPIDTNRVFFWSPLLRRCAGALNFTFLYQTSARSWYLLAGSNVFRPTDRLHAHDFWRMGDLAVMFKPAGWLRPRFI